ncbi:MAG: 5,10-methylenetetrahydrofolate reductase, partial [uncultured Frankineae bacterium]
AGADDQGHARPRRAPVLLRVLPGQDRRGRAPALDGDPAARAAAPRLRLRDVRRRRLDPRPHDRDDRAHRHRDDADAAGPPHGGRPLGRRAAPHRGAARGRRRPQRPGTARRPAGRPAGRVGQARAGPGVRLRARLARQGVGRLLRGRGGVPGEAPALGRLRQRRRALRREVPRRRRLRDHADVLPRRRLPAPARPGRRHRLRGADHPGRHARDERRADRADGGPVRRGLPARARRRAARRRRRPGRRAARGRRRGDRDVRPAAGRGRAGAALHHPEPVDGDAGDLVAARPAVGAEERV